MVYTNNFSEIVVKFRVNVILPHLELDSACLIYHADFHMDTRLETVRDFIR